MIPLNLLIGVPHLGEGQIPPYFWVRILVGTVGLIVFVHFLDMLLRRRERPEPPPREFKRLPARRARRPEADRSAPAQLGL